MTSLIDIKIYLFDCLFSLPMVYHVFDICRQVSSDVKIWGHHLDKISPLYQAVPVSKFDFVNLSNLLSLNTKLATVGDAFSPDYILNDDKLVTFTSVSQVDGRILSEFEEENDVIGGLQKPLTLKRTTDNLEEI